MPFLDGPPAERQEKTVDGLPTSVRLALYEMISLTLKVVRALQLVLEVSALRRGGEGPRFALCLRLELLKLVLKLIIRALTPFAFYCDEHSIYQALATQKEKQVRSMQVLLEKKNFESSSMSNLARTFWQVCPLYFGALWQS